MGGHGKGVEKRPGSIRLSFQWQGKTCRETLRTNGEPMAPTPANVRYAERLAGEIREKIKHGAFVYADYFPASQHATTGQGISVADQLDAWMKVQHDKEESTLKGYRVAVEWWKSKIGGTGIKSLKYSEILTALSSEPKWSGKTRNNKVSVLRQAMEMAVIDGVLAVNPVTPVKSSPHQKPTPDPFGLEEVEAILADMLKHYGEQIANYFETKFFTGLRTSESLALKWGAVDFRQAQIVVSDAVVLGEFKDRTKTNSSRAVQLNSRAMAALKRQKVHTFMAGEWIFPDPKTGKRWADDWTPREMYWRPTLKRLGIRYRSPYQTRHTYATIMLMSGVTPAYAARQMGHSIEMFLRTYAKWIDGGLNDLEMGKVEGLISPRSLPRKTAEP